MEINKEQLSKIAAIIGAEKMKEIIPEAFTIEFKKNNIYIYGPYKLHRVGDSETYAWIDMKSSNCFANGVDTPENLIKYAGKGLMEFENYDDYIRWAYSQLKKY